MGARAERRDERERVRASVGTTGSVGRRRACPLGFGGRHADQQQHAEGTYEADRCTNDVSKSRGRVQLEISDLLTNIAEGDREEEMRQIQREEEEKRQIQEVQRKAEAAEEERAKRQEKEVKVSKN